MIGTHTNGCGYLFDVLGTGEWYGGGGGGKKWLHIPLALCAPVFRFIIINMTKWKTTAAPSTMDWLNCNVNHKWRMVNTLSSPYLVHLGPMYEYISRQWRQSQQQQPCTQSLATQLNYCENLFHRRTWRLVSAMCECTVFHHDWLPARKSCNAFN